MPTQRANFYELNPSEALLHFVLIIFDRSERHAKIKEEEFRPYNP